MDSGALKAVIFVLFWGGVIGTVREWRYSRKHGLTITIAEKLYVLLVMPVFFVLGALLGLTGIPIEIVGNATLLAMCLAFNAWSIVRRVQRT